MSPRTVSWSWPHCPNSVPHLENPHPRCCCGLLCTPSPASHLCWVIPAGLAFRDSAVVCQGHPFPLEWAALLLVFLHLLGLWFVHCFGSRENVLALGTRRPSFSSLCLLLLGCLVTIASSPGLPSKQGGRAQIRKLGLGRVRRLVWHPALLVNWIPQLLLISKGFALICCVCPPTLEKALLGCVFSMYKMRRQLTRWAGLRENEDTESFGGKGRGGAYGALPQVVRAEASQSQGGWSGAYQNGALVWSVLSITWYSQGFPTWLPDCLEVHKVFTF